MFGRFVRTTIVIPAVVIAIPGRPGPRGPDPLSFLFRRKTCLLITNLYGTGTNYSFLVVFVENGEQTFNNRLVKSSDRLLLKVFLNRRQSTMEGKECH